MTNRRGSIGADLLVRALRKAGAECVFGIPGTQNLELFEALRCAGIRTVLTTTELAAGFMANGWYRASGAPGICAVISGPGFTYASTPLAEAAQDSCAILLITDYKPEGARPFDLQHIDQKSIAKAVGAEVVCIPSPAAILPGVTRAWHEMLSSGPRPVVLAAARAALREEVDLHLLNESASEPARQREPIPSDLLDAVDKSRRVFVLAGGGTLHCPDRLEDFVQVSGAVVATTPTARGVLPESHPSSLGFDFLDYGVGALNTIIDEADIVLSLGARLSHNGTGAFNLQLPAGRLAVVDLDPAVHLGSYKARWNLHMDVCDFLTAATLELRAKIPGDVGSKAEVYREALRSSRTGQRLDYSFPSLGGGPETFFAALRRALPDDAILVTDTGNHQIMARQFYQVRSGRGLIFPSDFQAMGFGLPAAIGAALAAPHRKVVALIGDGGFLASGQELVTAAREGLSLLVIVFRDGALGQIHAQQMCNFGTEFKTSLRLPDFRSMASANDIDYILADTFVEDQVRQAVSSPGVTLMEVEVGESTSVRRSARSVSRKNALKTLVGKRGTELLKRILP